MAKILIIGHGRHGKDTAGEILRDVYGLSFVSSSEFVAKEIFDDLNNCVITPYATPEEAYADRHSHRMLWKNLISTYNYPDKASMAKAIMKEYDIYVGMRCQQEYTASMTQGVFDTVLWVDASHRVGTVDPSMGIEFDPERMVMVDNNGDLDDLHNELKLLFNYGGTA